MLRPEGVAGSKQSLAREHHGRNTQALQLLYAIEGFLRRLSLSGYRDRLVLKGAMLLAVLDARRTTKDADLSAHGIPNDEASVARVVAEIATVVLPEPDWIVFDPASIATGTSPTCGSSAASTRSPPLRCGAPCAP